MWNFKFIVVLLFLLCLMSCDNSSMINQPSENDSGGICGVVTDFATGEPIKNANVQLRPTGETTLTGTEGYYEFQNIKEGNYSITVSKLEYTDLIDDYVITVVANRVIRRDVQIKKEPTVLHIIDNEGKELSVLDFGNEVTSKQFVIFNSGAVPISCKVFVSCEWIVSASEINNEIAPGGVWPIIVIIDHSKLTAGENTTYIHVLSNNGSKELKVTAIGEYIEPEVVTLPVTNSHNGENTPWNDTFNAEVIKIGNPEYSKRGFCFSSVNKTPTINDNCVEVSGSGLGKFKYTYREFPPQTITYYVRAWVMYGSDNEIIYGNTESFTYNDV